MKKRNEKIIIKAAFFAVLYSAALILLSFFVRNREMKARAQVLEAATEKSMAVVENKEKPEASPGTTTEGTPDGTEALLLRLEQTDSSYLCVPLPDDITSEGITAENHFMDGQLWLRMPDTDFLFYYDKAISGDVGNVRQAAAFQSESGGTVVRLALDNIYEYELISENQNLYIQLVSPKEKYDHVIVVDPASEEGADVTLSVADILSELAAESANTRIYQTRMNDVPCAQEKAAALANAVRADMLIRIEVERNEDSGVYGTLSRYSDEYYIPGFSSVDLADALERNVVTSLRSETRGIVKATGSDAAINNARIPAAVVVLGCISNVQENKLLLREDYQKKAAQGIIDAINAAFELRDKK